MSADDVVSAWERIESWLAGHAPLTAATLGPPATPAELAAAESALGVAFPPELVASLGRHDGSDPASPDRFTLAGYALSPLAAIVARARSLTGILADLAGGDTGLDDDTMTGWWWHPQWLPFADHIAADALAIDARPGNGRGRVGVFHHDDHTTFDHPSLSSLLHETADVLETHRPSPAGLPAGLPAGPELFGLVLRTVCAEAQAAFGMLRDRGHRHLISREDLTAWQARAAVAKALHVLLAGPPSAAAYEVLGPPDQFEDRDALLAALADVEPPPDAVERLEEHERAQARRGTALPVRFSRARRPR